VPAKSEELWSLLRLPASPGETRGEEAAPRFRAAPERAIAETKILFPRIESGSRVRTPAE